MNNLVTHLGNDCSDLRVVNSARVSFNKEHKEFNEEKDIKLINYLAKHGHWTPFSHSIFDYHARNISLPELMDIITNKNLMAGLSIHEVGAIKVNKEGNSNLDVILSGSFYAMVQLNKILSHIVLEQGLYNYMPHSAKAFGIDYDNTPICVSDIEQVLAPSQHYTTFRIKMPIFVARQWYKHQVDFSRNEVSRRYVDDAPEFHEPENWRLRAENKKQGSSEDVAEEGFKEEVNEIYHDNMLCLESDYKDLIKLGVAPEQARMMLPQSMYTEFYETASMDAYKRLIDLRTTDYAQFEIKQYALDIQKQLNENNYVRTNA